MGVGGAAPSGSRAGAGAGAAGWGHRPGLCPGVRRAGRRAPLIPIPGAWRRAPLIPGPPGRGAALPSSPPCLVQLGVVEPMSFHDCAILFCPPALP